MKMFRNLPVFVLAFLSILLFSFYGCQKEENRAANNVILSQEVALEHSITVEERGLSATYSWGPKGNVLKAVAIITSPIVEGTATNSKSVAWARSFGKSNDDAGHVIARGLGGRGEPKYIFPQSININRGAFRVFEAKVRNTVNTEGKANVVVTLNYNSTSAFPLRPVSISYTVQGGRGTKYYEVFPNP